jgi:hypothetical protein
VIFHVVCDVPDYSSLAGTDFIENKLISSEAILELVKAQVAIGQIVTSPC